MSMTLIRPIQTEIYCDVSLIERSYTYIITNNNIIVHTCVVYTCVIDERLKFDHETDKVDMNIIMLI